MIVNYPYSPEEIIRWAVKLSTLFPDADVSVYRKIVDNFLLGNAKFNKEIGILNFTLKVNSYIV